MKKRSSGFTLVEILVVLAIIAILAALLFPAFNSAREKSRQTSCQSNLQQIALAVQLYHNDFRRYPDALVDLLGESAKFDDGTATGSTLTTATATGYLKGGEDSLLCLDDDTLSDKPRSSYGSLSKSYAATTTDFGTAFTGDYGQNVWNFWGVKPDGFAFTNPTDAAAYTATDATTKLLLVDPSKPYDYPTNPIKYSISNRFAPPSTIVTHCVYHRLPTASNLPTPGMLYANVDDSKNAMDIVLRLDGSVRAVDVSTWKDNLTWEKQTP